MIDAMYLKRIALFVVVLVSTVPAFALPIGACLPVAKASAMLAKEGQVVATKTVDEKIVVTADDRGRGYVLKASNVGELCVSSTLDGVAKADINVNNEGQHTSDVCSNLKIYPDAKDVCSHLAKISPAPRAISATAPKSILSVKTVGRVNITFLVCKDSRGLEELCGRAETVKNDRP